MVRGRPVSGLDQGARAAGRPSQRTGAGHRQFGHQGRHAALRRLQSQLLQQAQQAGGVQGACRRGGGGRPGGRFDVLCWLLSLAPPQHAPTKPSLTVSVGVLPVPRLLQQLLLLRVHAPRRLLLRLLLLLLVLICRGGGQKGRPSSALPSTLKLKLCQPLPISSCCCTPTPQRTLAELGVHLRPGAAVREPVREQVNGLEGRAVGAGDRPRDDVHRKVWGAGEGVSEWGEGEGVSACVGAAGWEAVGRPRRPRGSSHRPPLPHTRL